MRILTYEHFTAVGPAVTPELRLEAGAMLAALTWDLARAGHEVSTVLASGFDFPWREALAGRGVRLAARTDFAEALGEVDAVWVIAPETAGRLESLARRAVVAGKRLLGSGPGAIAIAASKLEVSRRLAAAGVPVVPTQGMTSPRLPAAAPAWGFPLVVKPDDGVGCEGVGLVETPADAAPAWRRARAVSKAVVVQPFLAGAAASVSLVVAPSGDAFPLALQSQEVGIGPEFRYLGGAVPFEPPDAAAALAIAREACLAIPGLAGWVGVDMVLGAAGPVVVEVNPRLTTSYLGLRRVVPENLADLTLRALGGELLRSVKAVRTVRFNSSGASREARLGEPASAPDPGDILSLAPRRAAVA